MTFAQARSMLLWCAIVNYTMLITWFLMMVLPHEWLYRLWGRWFRLTREQFDAVNFAGIVFYKVLIILFNLVPFIVLLFVGT